MISYDFTEILSSLGEFNKDYFEDIPVTSRKLDKTRTIH